MLPPARKPATLPRTNGMASAPVAVWHDAQLALKTFCPCCALGDNPGCCP